MLRLLLFHCAIETWKYHLAQPHPQSVVPACVQMETTPYPPVPGVMVPDLLVSKAQHSDSVFQKVFNFYFQSCLPRQPLYPAQQFLRELADISKGAQNTCTSLVVWYLSWSLVGGWFSEMCVLTLAGSLLSPKLGPHAKHLKRVVKCFIGTRVCDS